MIYFNTQAYLNRMAEGNKRTFDSRRMDDFGGFSAWKHAFREQLHDILGISLIRSLTPDGPFSASLIMSEEMDSHIRELWHMEVEPEIRMPFYALLPKKGDRPFPLVIAPHGHECGKEAYVGKFSADAEREAAVAIDQTIALQAVEEGYAVLAPNVRGFKEMARMEDITDQYEYPVSNPYTKKNSCEELQRRSMLYGRTLMGDRAYDMMRLLDYAQSRADFDMTRVIMTGNSTGGVVTTLTAALDDRVAIAVPSCSFCNFADSALVLYHCSCNIIHGILQLCEYEDIAGLIAPRPLLFINGREDSLFPIDGALKAFAHVRNVYADLGAGERCELFVGPGGHRFYKERAWSFIRDNLEKQL